MCVMNVVIIVRVIVLGVSCVFLALARALTT